MALRDNPYLPLYVQDFMTDEKLADCCAATNGVYIRLMCILHKSSTYGKILLKQKYKQNESNIANFASMLLRQMPYEYDEIYEGLCELVDNEIITIDADWLYQKRMVKDGELSDKRAVAGSLGGKKSLGFCSSKSSSKTRSKNTSKIQANTENENDIENENENVNIKFSMLKELISIGVDKHIAEAWIKVRKNKKLTNTQIAFDKTKREIEKSGYSANDCIRLCVERSWGGFKAEWCANIGEDISTPKTDFNVESNIYQ